LVIFVIAHSFVVISFGMMFKFSITTFIIGGFLGTLIGLSMKRR
jgi:hypothetical protein